MSPDQTDPSALRPTPWRQTIKPVRRSVVPETTLALAALTLGALALAAHHPREADQLIARVASAILPVAEPLYDMETTASITPRRTRSPAPDERRQPLPQFDGEDDRSSAPRIDIGVGEDSLRGSY